MSGQPQIATEKVTVVIDQQVLDEVRQGTDRALRLIKVLDREHLQGLQYNQVAICIALGIALENHWGIGWRAEYPVPIDPWSSERQFAIAVPPGQHFMSWTDGIRIALPQAVAYAAGNDLDLNWFRPEGLPEPISFQIELPLA